MEEVKKGVRAWKDKKSSRDEGGSGGAQQGGGGGGGGGGDHNVLRDIRELSNVPPAVHALVDKLCQTFESDGSATTGEPRNNRARW